MIIEKLRSIDIDNENYSLCKEAANIIYNLKVENYILLLESIIYIIQKDHTMLYFFEDEIKKILSITGLNNET